MDFNLHGKFTFLGMGKNFVIGSFKWQNLHEDRKIQHLQQTPKDNKLYLQDAIIRITKKQK